MAIRRRPSSTAEAAAAARACGAMQKDPLLRCPDDMAIRFVGGFFRFLLLPGIRSRFIEEYERRAAGVFFHHQVRTKHIDGLLARELASGTSKQVVVLGAGFDSRAYRFASKLGGARVFEVDHPTTSGIKQRRVRRIVGALPSHVTYVAVDFSRETMDGRLAEARYDPSLPTFFIWEGVSTYLEAAAVDATLAVVARAGKGSSIVFDYMHRSALQAPDAATKRHIAGAAKMGEPYRFGVNHEDVGALVARSGLTLEENLSAGDLGERYLVATDGTRWGASTPSLSLAHARLASA